MLNPIVKFSKLMILFSFVSVLVICVIIFSQRYQSPEKRFESFVISPIPLEIKNIECIEQWKGIDPEFYFRLQYTEAAYQLLLKQHKFKSAGATFNSIKNPQMSNLKVLEYFDNKKKHFHYISRDDVYIYYLVSTI